jgi:hypothetical protein
MKVRYLARDLCRFRRCPHGRLYSALKKHFGHSLKRYRWVDDRQNQTRESTSSWNLKMAAPC